MNCWKTCICLYFNTWFLLCVCLSSFGSRTSPSPMLLVLISIMVLNLNIENYIIFWERIVSQLEKCFKVWLLVTLRHVQYIGLTYMKQDNICLKNEWTSSHHTTTAACTSLEQHYTCTILLEWSRKNQGRFDKSFSVCSPQAPLSLFSAKAVFLRYTLVHL